MINTVIKLCHLLNKLDFSWAIVGGCNLYLRKCKANVNDIDIITSREGSNTIFNNLKKYIASELSYSELNNVRSYYFTSCVDGIIVEVMGDVENKIRDTWIKNTIWEKNIELFVIDQTNIPLTTLVYEMYINRQLGNELRVRTIENCITKVYKQQLIATPNT